MDKPNPKWVDGEPVCNEECVFCDFENENAPIGCSSLCGELCWPAIREQRDEWKTRFDALFREWQRWRFGVSPCEFSCPPWNDAETCDGECDRCWCELPTDYKENK